MKVTSDMTINAVLEIDEEKMLHTLAWLAPELGRLQSPNALRAVIGRRFGPAGCSNSANSAYRDALCFEPGGR